MCTACWVSYYFAAISREQSANGGGAEFSMNHDGCYSKIKNERESGPDSKPLIQ